MADDERELMLVAHNNLTTEVRKIQKITDPDQYRRVSAIRATLKTGLDYFEGRWRPHIEAAHRQHKALIASLGADIKPATMGYQYAGILLGNYDQEQERIRKQAQLEAEIAERKRAKAENDRLVALAKELGDKELVKEMKAAPLRTEPVVVEKQTPKVEGQHFRDHWAAKIVNYQVIPDEYWVVDEQAIGQAVRESKGKIQIPGVEVVHTRIPVQK